MIINKLLKSKRYSYLLILTILMFFIELSSSNMLSRSYYNYSLNQISRDDNNKKAGLQTMFELLPGGGERYFLSSALTFLKMGFEVQFILYETNLCNTRECVDKTLKELRIPLTSDKYSIRLVKSTDFLEKSDDYEVYFTIGNEKFPFFNALGKYNIYMCQFPYDYRNFYKRKWYFVRQWTEYDLILVNSRYSYDWYLQGVQSGMYAWFTEETYVPFLALLYPPVTPFDNKLNELTQLYSNDDDKILNCAKEFISGKPLSTEMTKIAVFGRFFRGQQSKGHDIAIEIFSKLVTMTKLPLELHLIGFIQAGQANQEYATELLNNSTKLNLNIIFHFNAEPDEIGKLLPTIAILWHLTGINKILDVDNLVITKKQDPASVEHFGVVIVEAMMSGAIPIVTKIGGPIDIIEHKINGFLSESLDDYITYTLEILQLNEDQLYQLKYQAFHTSTGFSTNQFELNLKSLVTEGLKSSEIRHVIRKEMPFIRNLTYPEYSNARGDKIAVIVETGLNSNLELCVRNIMHYLGPDWQVHFYYGWKNEDIVMMHLRFVKNIVFKPILFPIHTQRHYDRFIKSSEFWKSYIQVETTKVLIFDSDTLMLRHGINDFLNYDYISSPINKNLLLSKKDNDNDNIDKLHSHNHHNIHKHNHHNTEDSVYTNKNGIGFGSGFSLRKATTMYHISKLYENTSSDDEHESIFFLKHLRKLGYKVADRQTSYMFCREIELPNIVSQSNILPLAIHKAWIHMPNNLIDNYIKINALGEIKKKLYDQSLLPTDISSIPLLSNNNGNKDENKIMLKKMLDQLITDFKSKSDLLLSKIENN